MTDIIYHYCSIETLLSIFKNGTLRLTDINKMNNHTETRFILNFLYEILIDKLNQNLENYEPLIKHCPNYYAISIIAKNVVDKIFIHNNSLIYATSFSQNQDLSSEWCKYANNGKGVAIGFSTKAINNIIMSYNSDAPCGFENPFKMKKVKYISNNIELSNKFHNFADDIVKRTLNVIDCNSIISLFNNSEYSSVHYEFEKYPLLQEAAFTKGKENESEEEIRLIFDFELNIYDNTFNVPYNSNNSQSQNPIQKWFPQSLQFRITDCDVLSYLDLDFNNFKDDIIQEIVLGPNCKLTFQDITQMLLRYNYPNIKYIQYKRSNLTCSKLTYR